jgi:MscS family membrane protein
MPVDDVYRLTQSLTGWMIPLVLADALPEWSKTLVLDMLLWKWFALVLLFALALGAVIVVVRWVRRRPWDGSLRSYLRHLSTPLAILALTPLLWSFATYQINVTGSAAQVPFYPLEVAFGVAVVWVVWLTASGIAEAVIASPSIGSQSLDAHLIRLAARSIGILATLVLFFRVATDVGVPVYGLVAGAGVGGLPWRWR